MTVAVLTDSSAVVPDGWPDTSALRVIPLELGWPDGTTSPGDVSFGDYAEMERVKGGHAKTAATSPGIYQQVFEELLVDHEGVVVVCPAVELSATYANAVLSARNSGFGERVRVVDARTAAAGQGLVAIEAARASHDGVGIDVVVERALEVAGRMEIWATLVDLDRLRRSGRIPALAAIGAGALGLQPVVKYSKTSPTIAGVTRSADRAADRIFRAWERSFVAPWGVRGADGAERSGPPVVGALHAVAFHCDREGHATQICKRVAERVPGAELAVTGVTGGLAAHTGPGLLGLAWFWDN